MYNLLLLNWIDGRIIGKIMVKTGRNPNRWRKIELKWKILRNFSSRLIGFYKFSIFIIVKYI